MISMEVQILDVLEISILGKCLCKMYGTKNDTSMIKIEGNCFFKIE